MIHKMYHPLATTSLTNLDSAAAYIQEFENTENTQKMKLSY